MVFQLSYLRKDISRLRRCDNWNKVWMLGKHKIVVFAFMFGLILLSNYVVPTYAQPDDFPIGMNLTYVVVVDIPSVPLHTEVWNEYEFIRWIDQENLTVEYEIGFVTFIKRFHEILLPGPDLPPLWMDVSTWNVGDTIEISGSYYPIIIMESMFIGPPGSVLCFRLETVVEANNRENATSFWYDAQLGLLVDYTRMDIDIPSDEMIKANLVFLVDGNFNEFNPPTFTVPVTTTTTTTTTIPPDTTTTSTTTTTYPPDQTTTTPTTSTARSMIIPLVGLNEVFGIGIMIEVIVIILVLRQRK